MLLGNEIILYKADGILIFQLYKYLLKINRKKGRSKTELYKVHRHKMNPRLLKKTYIKMLLQCQCIWNLTAWSPSKWALSIQPRNEIENNVKSRKESIWFQWENKRHELSQKHLERHWCGLKDYIRKVQLVCIVMQVGQRGLIGYILSSVHKQSCPNHATCYCFLGEANCIWCQEHCHCWGLIFIWLTWCLPTNP